MRSIIICTKDVKAMRNIINYPKAAITMRNLNYTKDAKAMRNIINCTKDAITMRNLNYIKDAKAM